MPGLVVFRRRWSIASDDFVLPALLLLLIHLTWLCLMITIMAAAGPKDWDSGCTSGLLLRVASYIAILILCIIVEFLMLKISMRGAILQVDSRKGLNQIIYAKVILMVIEFVWLILTVKWIHENYATCSSDSFSKQTILIIAVTNWLIMFLIFISIICTFDVSGHESWVQRYQKRRGRRKSEIERSWGRRCHLLFCCLKSSDRSHGSLAHVVTLMSDFFEDMDLVASDILAGLILLRQLQRMQRQVLIQDVRSPVCDFLSGVEITSETQFLDLSNDQELEMTKELIYYMRYCLSSYGWPVAVMTRSKCCSFGGCWSPKNVCQSDLEFTGYGDNSCHCNEATFKQMFQTTDCELVYANYSSEICEPSFFVAIDHEKLSIVITIRGTRSLKDLITDLNAEPDFLPLNPVKNDWLGHKGMIEAAEYVKEELVSGLLRQAFLRASKRSRVAYRLVLVGHSLGAGTASILSILMHSMYPDLQCYAFSPPGGLLSEPAALFSRSFITSVVVGKDVVPRLGLHQMKLIQKDILAALSFSNDPKWKVIGYSCCSCSPTGSHDDEGIEEQICQAVEFWSKRNRRDIKETEEDRCCLLLPPGRILHVVRSHRKQQHKQEKDMFHQAVWSCNQDFEEILISPVMFADHLPHNVMKALEALLDSAPVKPQETRSPSPAAASLFTYGEPIYTSIAPAATSSFGRTPTPNSMDTIFTQKLVVETSFTDLHLSSIAEASDYCRGSTYSKPSYLSALRFHRKNDLFRHDWIRTAPLASPENASLATSYFSHDADARHREKGSSNDNSVCVSAAQRSDSQVSMQELIDVFSEQSETRSLEEMVYDAKRITSSQPDNSIQDLHTSIPAVSTGI